MTLVAVLTFACAAPSVLVGPQPFLWWQVGLAVVCAGVWRGVRVGVVYGVLLAAAWTWLRLTSAGWRAGLTIAGAEGVSGVVAGIVIAVVARGMIESSVAADARAREVSAMELRQALEKALGEERARLDQLIHDDVMTTLTAAAQSTDDATGRATALLADETLSVLDAQQGPPAGGSLSVAVLAGMAAQTVLRVSPDVGFLDQVEPGRRRAACPSAVAGRCWRPCGRRCATPCTTRARAGHGGRAPRRAARGPADPARARHRRRARLRPHLRARRPVRRPRLHARGQPAHRRPAAAADGARAGGRRSRWSGAAGPPSRTG